MSILESFLPHRSPRRRTSSGGRGRAPAPYPAFLKQGRVDPSGKAEKYGRCSNFVRVARYLSPGAFNGVPPRELDESDVASRTNVLVAALTRTLDLD